MFNPLDNPEDPRYPGLFVGTVTDTNDPLGIGRVRFRIPGFIEPPSAWALPIGTLGGGKGQRGAFFIPEKDSEVGILFKHGDVDSPYYMGGFWGSEVGEDASDETPTPIQSEPKEDRPKLRAIESEKFYIFFDDREGTEEEPDAGKQRLLIQSKDEPDLFIELDALNRGIIISAVSDIRLQSVGLVEINGVQVQINGRRVANSTKDI